MAVHEDAYDALHAEPLTSREVVGSDTDLVDPLLSAPAVDPLVSAPALDRKELEEILADALKPLCECMKRVEASLSKACLNEVPYRAQFARGATTRTTTQETLATLQLDLGLPEEAPVRDQRVVLMASPPEEVIDENASVANTNEFHFHSSATTFNCGASNPSRGVPTELSPVYNEFIYPDDSHHVSLQPHSAANLGMNALVKEQAPRSNAGKMVKEMMVRNEMAVVDSRLRTHSQMCIDRMLRFVMWWENLQEPERSGCIYRITSSCIFEALSLTVIVLNSVFVAYEADYEMRYLHRQVPDAFKQASLGFLIFFSVELLMRLFAHRLYFFANYEMRWNWLDFWLVILSICDYVVFILLDPSTDGDNSVVFMRVLRLLKLARIFRTFRAMKFFKDLGVMMESFANSAVALFWTFIMLFFILYVFALVFLQGLADLVRTHGESLSGTDKEDIGRHFGTMGKAMLSLYQAVTGGNDWAIYYNVVEKAGAAQAAAFIFFLFFFNFSLYNILTGLFVEKAVAAASPDAYDQVLQQRRKAQQDSVEFLHLCSILDTDKSGTISWHEFESMMLNPTMVAYMASIGLQVHEVETFFQVVAGSHREEVDIDRFVDGCMQMKGFATGIDVQKQLFELRKLQDAVRKFEKRSAAQISHMSQLLSKCGQVCGQTQRAAAALPAMPVEAAAAELPRHLAM